MVYNSFYTNVITRVLVLLLTLIGLAYLIANSDRFFSMLFLAILVIVQTISLLTFLNRTNRNLARFLLLLTEEDTSVISWKNQVEKTFKGLHHSFKKVNEEISRIRLEKEKGAILLRNVINQINSGILAVDEAGEVEVINAEALKIFGLSRLLNIDELDRLQKGLSRELLSLKYESGNVLEFVRNDEYKSLLVKASLLKLEEKSIRLYSIQNIGTQLEAHEIESWQKMTRVLSHEISNSVTPISTLGAGIHRKLSKASYDKSGRMVLPGESAHDVIQSSNLLQQRCNAMVEFMEYYKSFARLPDPVIERINVNQLLDNLARYFKDESERQKIKLSMVQPEQSLFINADLRLLDQALINLIRNSMAAIEENGGGVIEVKAEPNDEGGVILRVKDDGPGISPDIQSQVFIPFFTTRSGGTGIGLSIAKKIAYMLGGTIHFISEPGQGTSFFMELPEYR